VEIPVNANDPEGEMGVHDVTDAHLAPEAVGGVPEKDGNFVEFVIDLTLSNDSLSDRDMVYDEDDEDGDYVDNEDFDEEDM
jgi:hypothetical protein